MITQAAEECNARPSIPVQSSATQSLRTPAKRRAPATIHLTEFQGAFSFHYTQQGV